MAPPDVCAGLEVNIFEQHGKGAPDLLMVIWNVDQRCAACGARQPGAVW